MSAEWIIGLVPLLLFLAFGACGVYSTVTGYRLLRYLEEFHHDRWCYLTYVPFLGQGSGNGFRGLQYMFSDKDNDDPKIVVLKAAVKRSLLYVLCVLGAALLMVLVVFVIIVFFQK